MCNKSSKPVENDIHCNFINIIEGSREAPVEASSRERFLKWRNCRTWTFKLKGLYSGSVHDPTMAKFAPLWKFDPNESRYGLKNLVFKLWPAYNNLIRNMLLSTMFFFGNIKYHILCGLTGIPYKQFVSNKVQVHYYIVSLKGIYLFQSLRVASTKNQNRWANERWHLILSWSIYKKNEVHVLKLNIKLRDCGICSWLLLYDLICYISNICGLA